MARSHNRELISSLDGYPPFEALREYVKDRMEVEATRLSRDFLLFNNQPDYAQLQHRRGRYAGMKELLDLPAVITRRQNRERDEVE